MARTIPPPTIIEIPTPTRTGLRGRIEKLFHEFNTKAQALRLTAEILDEDDRRAGLVDAPKKFRGAINHRNGDTGRPLLPKARKPKAPKPPIHGHRLILFLLEHLDDTPRPSTYFLEKLTSAGSPQNGDIRVMNGPLGAVCRRRGWAKRTADGGYSITARGAAHAITLRKELEAAGKVTPGGYTAT